MRWVKFLPAVLASLTDCVVAFIARADQQDHPDRVIILRVVMFAAAPDHGELPDSQGEDCCGSGWLEREVAWNFPGE
jgi:hypothetical protein